MIWLVLTGGILVSVIVGLPIGIGLALTGLLILQVMAGGATALAATSVWNVFTDFTFSAVPIFIFLGDILLVSGIGDRIYTAIAPAFQRIPGRLLHSNIAVCTLFGAVSGSSMSTAAAIGSVAYPELKRRGYDRPTVVATLAAGGTLGLLIPPSLSLLIYGATMEVSIGRLFLAGILPGLMIAALFMGWILIDALRRPHITPSKIDIRPLRERLKAVAGLWPVGFLVFAVLGTIYTGIATPTEAAGLGVGAAIVLGFSWGTLTPRKLWQAFFSSTLVFGAIAVVIMGALILAQSISIIGLPQQVMAHVGDFGLSKYSVLAVLVVIYLVLGCFFDGISMMLMTLPIVYPVMVALGFDPIWLGVILTIMIEIGQLTPPVGVNLFVLTAITSQEVSLAESARAALPYWLILLLGVAILIAVPDVALVLPRLLG